MLISSDDLSGLKSLNQDGMDDRVLVERNTPSADGIGGQRESWSTITSAQACRVRKTARDPRTAVIAQHLDVTTIYEVIFPFGANVLEGDRLTITHFQGGSTQAMRVEAVLRFTYETSRVCVCTEDR